MKELVVISGKGGTGKTCLVACFAALAEKAVLADCDVDAADLHLILEPRIIRRESFSGGKRARIVPDLCTSCGRCEEICRFGAISRDGTANGKSPGRFSVDPISCEGCGVCAHLCPDKAIEFGPVINGEWFISETRYGPMVHAKLGIAEENSGKLVSTVRTEARKLAEQRGLEVAIIDGSPGIGCPVIASITGADLVLVVTEPTLSGQHDLTRVADLTSHFGIPTLVCINKWDINPEITSQIELQALSRRLRLAGRIRYDRSVTEAMMQEKAVVEYQDQGCAEDIRCVWREIRLALLNPGQSDSARKTAGMPASGSGDGSPRASQDHDS